MACAHNWYSGVCLNCGIGTAAEATIARLTAELAEAREKNGVLIEMAAKRFDHIGTGAISEVIRALVPDATAALAARDKRVREETLNAANDYLTVQYGLMALGHPIDRERALAAIQPDPEQNPVACPVDHSDMATSDCPKCGSFQDTTPSSAGMVRVNDGRPMSTDEFLMKLFVSCDDFYDQSDAIYSWMEGDWINALMYLEDEK